MEEACSGKRGCGHCSCLLFCRRKSRCCPRFIVVLDETEQFPLVGKVSAEMEPNILCILVFKSIIESLVVAEVEAMLLQLPLQVPISLGNEAHVRIRFLN